MVVSKDVDVGQILCLMIFRHSGKAESCGGHQVTFRMLRGKVTWIGEFFEEEMSSQLELKVSKSLFHY